MDDEFSKFYKECAEVEAAVQSTDSNNEDKTHLEEKKPEVKIDESTLPEIKIEVNTAINDAITKVSTEDISSDSNDTLQENAAEGNIPDDGKSVIIEQKAATIENVSDDSRSGKESHSEENVRYENNEAIYTDPVSKVEYSWDTEQKRWMPKEFKPVFDGKTYKVKNPEGGFLIWNSEKSSWEKEDAGKDPPLQAIYGFDGEHHTYTDPRDNSAYFWDKDKSAWFPKVDEDFMARYQMNYGFVDNTTKEETPQEVKDLKRKAPSEPSWFDMDEQHNTKVYVSNLPLELKEQEFVDFMQKCGLVLKDLKTNKFKVKLYTEPDGKTFKGDALCDYIKIESVDLALNVLDGADFKGKKVKVQRAKFQMKGDYNPALKPKKKKKKEKEKELKMQQKLLDWRPDKLRGEREKNEKTVVVKNLFTPSLFDANVELILEYTEDIRSEATKCGIVRKVVLYDKHPEGIATVTFDDAEEADICLKLFNNRWFGKRKVIAETWDGKTKYKVVESEEEVKQRLEKWNSFLEAEERVKK